MKVGDLVSNGYFTGTIVELPNSQYCRVLWNDGAQEWLRTQTLRVVICGRAI